MTVSQDPSGTPAKQLRLLVVDDHEVVRQGLVALLDRRPGFQVVAEAGTVAESIEAARRFQPDIVVMDVRLPDGSGIEACREMRAELPDTKVVMLTSYPDDDAVLSAIVAKGELMFVPVLPPALLPVGETYRSAERARPPAATTSPRARA